MLLIGGVTMAGIESRKYGNYFTDLLTELTGHGSSGGYSSDYKDAVRKGIFRILILLPTTSSSSARIQLFLLIQSME